jgi:hypothetical protein
MIKRDTLQRVLVHAETDNQGGSPASYEDMERVNAHVSINTTFGEITAYGIKDDMIIHATTDVYLDTNLDVRYRFNGKLFKLMRQVKSGNEYYSVLREVYN